MINFPAITAVNTSIASTRVQAQTQPQAQSANVQTPVVNFTQSNSTLGLAAMRAQVEASDIQFNQNFYNNIQYLNAQASLGIHKQVDGKIFVSSDMFTQEQAAKLTVSDIQRRLDNIDNLAKDKNGSESLFYTKADTNKKQEQHKAPSFAQIKRLENVYA